MSVAVSLNGRYYKRRGIKELSSPAYVKDIIEPLQRFDEKNTPLSRGYVPPGGWQDSFLETLIPHIGEQGPVPRDEPGYTQIDVALGIAGFHCALASNCHTGNWTRPRLSEELGCFYDWEGRWSPGFNGLAWNPEKMPIDDPAEMSEIIKDAALFLGASLVRITELNRSWLYRMVWDRYGHNEIDLDKMIPSSIKYAVVMAVETNYDYVKHAPTAKAGAAAGLGYSKMAFLASSLAKFIASLGYKSIACGNDTALSIPLAVDAGLGQLGRFGGIITPEFGPIVRLCKVITDIPLKPTAPIDFGVTEFCEVCQQGLIKGEKRYYKYKERGFPTPSGKVEIYSSIMEKGGYDPLPKASLPVELGEDYPLLMTSAKPKDFFHSGYRNLESLRERHGSPSIRIHPQAASKEQILDGDTVAIISPYGRIHQKAVLTESLDPRVVSADYGWWFPEKGEKELLPGGNPISIC